MKDSGKECDGIPADVAAEAERLARGAEILPAGVAGLARKLQEARSEGRVLRVKLGVDPTSSDLHLGHAVVLRALRRFQDAGHQAVLIVGGFTAQLGDPTGRNKTRPQLTGDDVAANADTYLAQVGSILDMTRLEVVDNSTWFSAMTLGAMLKLASQATVNQLVAKEAFGQRLDRQEPVGLHELFYPLLQGHDSVMVKADVELGGSDQRFNILAGRQMQLGSGQPAQVAMLLPLLTGIDGEKKMSKSLGNAIGLKDAPADMFARTMRIPDRLIVSFFELATAASAEDVAGVRARMEADGANPKDLKEELARRLVVEFHGEAAADAALAEWRRVHSERLAPEAMPSHVVSSPVPLVRLMVELSLAESNTKARKLIEGGAVRIDGVKVEDAGATVPVPSESGVVLSVGRRKFARLTAARS